MKKLFVLLMVLFFGNIKAQESLRSNLNLILNQKYNELITDNKLLLLHSASANLDQTQNITNEELEKTAKVYANAKLKGGKKGLVCVVIAENTDQVIALKKALKYCYVINKADVEKIDLKERSTMIIDSEGNISNDQVQSNAIYSTVQSLITR
ncbi:MAG: hypothetical protein ACK50A_14070 [Sphingobacteriaceae bacterium]